MHRFDGLFTKYPFYGVDRMTAHLSRQGPTVNVKRIRRLMHKIRKNGERIRICVHAVNVKRKTVRIMLERKKLCQQKSCGRAEKSLKRHSIRCCSVDTIVETVQSF